ncbi:unnamed protein product [Trichogramma brassicae]|uniref:Uncharacterized protein n=1 Tax=Trichogramma brassicae TaxID=86971 RepID=A0A6H5J5B4_9HYME|nr:unnamed protein product [Trichogramma brassicae]
MEKNPARVSIGTHTLYLAIVAALARIMHMHTLSSFARLAAAPRRRKRSDRRARYYRSTAQHTGVVHFLFAVFSIITIGRCSPRARDCAALWCTRWVKFFVIWQRRRFRRSSTTTTATRRRIAFYFIVRYSIEIAAVFVYIDGRENLVKKMKKRNRYYRLVARANYLQKTSSDVQDSPVSCCPVHCLRHAAAVATIAATSAEAAYV